MNSQRLANFLTASLIAASTVVTSLSGCAPKASPQGPKDSGEKKDGIVSAKITDKPITLKYLAPLQHSDILTSYNDIEAYKELEKRTGIHIEWNQPSEIAQNIKLVIASNDLPDIIQANNVSWFPGGPDKLIEDKVILRLNELIDKNAPNFKKAINQTPDTVKLAKTDKGNIYSFYKFNDAEPNSWAGPKIRKDLLEKYNMAVPETIDDWYMLLKKIKGDGIEIPLMLEVQGWNAVTGFGVFISAYGISKDFYKDGSKIAYGAIQPQYKEFLATFRKWYEEGLIPTDWDAIKSKDINTLAGNGKVGAAATVTDFGNSIVAVAAPFPVLKKGEMPKTNRKVESNNGNAAVITTACKYQEEAVKWFDYGYSEEGAKLFNWGIEGLHYKIVDGKPIMTDLLLNDPLGPANAQWKYHLHNSPFLVFTNNALQTPEDKLTEVQIQNKKNAAVWDKIDKSMAMPALTLTPEEQSKVDEIMTELNTYVNQMYYKFIKGQEPLSNFDSYVSTVKKMGIEEVIKIQQAAYDRYLKR